LSVSSVGYLSWQVGNVAITSNTPLELYKWTLITANFVLSSFINSANNLLSLYQDGNIVAYNYVANVGITGASFLTTDKVQLGGLLDSFYGSIKDLSIYSPGTLQINNRIFL